MRFFLVLCIVTVSACVAAPKAVHREPVEPFTFGCGTDPDGSLGPPWVEWDGANLTLSNQTATLRFAISESVVLAHRDDTPATADNPGAVYTFKGFDVLSNGPNGETRAVTLTSVLVAPSGSDEFSLKLSGAALTPNEFLWGATSVDLGPCKKKNSQR